MTKFRFSLLLIVVFTLIFTAQTVLAADIGPKPSMEFEFQQDSSGENISISSGVLYECQQADCSDAAPLEELGPQRFYCDEFRCSALSYGFAPYHRIEIQFSDGKTRQSNIFETIDFQSYYIVTINPDDLFVEESFGSPAPPFEEPFPEETFEPSSGGRNSMPRVMLGFGVLLCVGLVSLLAVGLVIFFFVRRSRTK